MQRSKSSPPHTRSRGGRGVKRIGVKLAGNKWEKILVDSNKAKECEAAALADARKDAKKKGISPSAVQSVTITPMPQMAKATFVVAEPDAVALRLHLEKCKYSSLVQVYSKYAKSQNYASAPGSSNTTLRRQQRSGSPKRPPPPRPAEVNRSNSVTTSQKETSRGNKNNASPNRSQRNDAPKVSVTSPEKYTAKDEKVQTSGMKEVWLDGCFGNSLKEEKEYCTFSFPGSKWTSIVETRKNECRQAVRDDIQETIPSSFEDKDFRVEFIPKNEGLIIHCFFMDLGRSSMRMKAREGELRACKFRRLKDLYAKGPTSSTQRSLLRENLNPSRTPVRNSRFANSSLRMLPVSKDRIAYQEPGTPRSGLWLSHFFDEEDLIDETPRRGEVQETNPNPPNKSTVYRRRGSGAQKGFRIDFEGEAWPLLLNSFTDDFVIALREDLVAAFTLSRMSMPTVDIKFSPGENCGVSELYFSDAEYSTEDEDNERYDLFSQYTFDNLWKKYNYLLGRYEANFGSAPDFTLLLSGSEWPKLLSNYFDVFQKAALDDAYLALRASGEPQPPMIKASLLLQGEHARLLYYISFNSDQGDAKRRSSVLQNYPFPTIWAHYSLYSMSLQYGMEAPEYHAPKRYTPIETTPHDRYPKIETPPQKSSKFNRIVTSPVPSEDSLYVERPLSLPPPPPPPAPKPMACVGVQTKQPFHVSIGLQTTRSVHTSIGLQTIPQNSPCIGVQTRETSQSSVGLQTQTFETPQASVGIQTHGIPQAAVGVQTQKFSQADVSVQTQGGKNSSVGLQTSPQNLPCRGIQTQNIPQSSVGLQTPRQPQLSVGLQKRASSPYDTSSPSAPTPAPLPLQQLSSCGCSCHCNGAKRRDNDVAREINIGGTTVRVDIDIDVDRSARCSCNRGPVNHTTLPTEQLYSEKTEESPRPVPIYREGTPESARPVPIFRSGTPDSAKTFYRDQTPHSARSLNIYREERSAAPAPSTYSIRSELETPSTGGRGVAWSQPPPFIDSSRTCYSMQGSDSAAAASGSDTLHRVGFPGKEWTSIAGRKIDAFVSALTKELLNALPAQKVIIEEVVADEVYGIISKFRLLGSTARSDQIRERLKLTSFPGIWRLYEKEQFHYTPRMKSIDLPPVRFGKEYGASQRSGYMLSTYPLHFDGIGWYEILRNHSNRALLLQAVEQDLMKLLNGLSRSDVAISNPLFDHRGVDVDVRVAHSADEHETIVQSKSFKNVWRFYKQQKKMVQSIR